MYNKLGSKNTKRILPVNKTLTKSALLVLCMLFSLLWISGYLPPLENRAIIDNTLVQLPQPHTHRSAPAIDKTPSPQPPTLKTPKPLPQFVNPSPAIGEYWGDPIEEPMEFNEIGLHLEEPLPGEALLTQDDANTRFDIENRNGYWADDAENKYIGLFSSMESLSEYTLINTECKKTSCKLSFAVTDTFQLSRLTSDLISALVEKHEHIDITFSTLDEEGNGVAVLYLTPSASTPKDT